MGLHPWLAIASLFLAGTLANRIENRHSYSLSTFSSDGRLVQVDRAMEAMSHGVPVVVAMPPSRSWTLMISPQTLPSPLYIDDGTSRFSQVSPEIAVAHTGITADGRVLVTAAQRLAIEHEYTFDEHIGISTFLEEMSLLFQEATMNPGRRPFGSCLLVSYLPSSEEDRDRKSQIYRIDPSGCVQEMGQTTVVNWEHGDLQAVVDNILSEGQSLDVARERIMDAFRTSLLEREKKQGIQPVLTGVDEAVRSCPTKSLLVASMTSDGKFEKSKHIIG